MGDNLFVIGNGLDLYFGLPTKTDDFCNCLRADAVDFYSECGINWSSWEEGLEDIDIDEANMLVESAPDYMSDSEDDREGTVIEAEEKLNEILELRNRALETMVAKANSELIMKRLNHKLPSYNKNLFSNSTIINFNYTSTVEKLFDIDNSYDWHIHGCYEDDDQLIFGFDKRKGYSQNYHKRLYGDTSRDIDPYIFRQYEKVLEFYDDNCKKYQTEKLVKVLKDYNSKKVDSIIVLGHSMGDVDHQYMEIIEKILKPDMWIISYYKNTENYDDYSFSSRIQQMPLEKLIN